MRAVGVRTLRGSPEVLEVPKPDPGPGELLVELVAAGVNPFDWKILDGILAPRPHVSPTVAGIDGAGVVTALGPGARRFPLGERVFGQFLYDPVGRGTYAEFAAVPESAALTRIPPGLSEVQAAAIPTAAMTARDALDRLEVQRGSTLLIVGASGGVGSFATQLARVGGATIIATARAASSDRLRSLGAHEVVDPTDSAWVERLGRAHPEGVDALLDLMSPPEGLARVAALVGPGGRLASTVYAVGPKFRLPRGGPAFNVDLQPSAPLLERVTDEIGRNGLVVPVTRTISLDEAPAALAEVRAGRAVGKTVIQIRASPGR